MLDPFDTLGIAPEFDVDLAALEKRYRDLSRVLHPDRHVAGSAGERRLALGKAIETNEAWRILRDPVARAEALLRRRAKPGVEADPDEAPVGASRSEARVGASEPRGSEARDKVDPAFLMEMLEQREALSDARRSGDHPRVAALEADIRARQQAALAKLRALLGDGSATTDRAAVPILGELRYYQRFLDEVSAIEDEHADAQP